MTQQGFKRFRRRTHRSSTASDPNMEILHEAESAYQPAEFSGGGRGKADPYAKSEEAFLLPAKLPPLWDRLPLVPFDAENPVATVVPLVSACRNAPAARAFDLLRTRLLQTLKARGWRSIAVCAPTTGCGTTFTAVNLALSLARVASSRTVLMDFNFRTPGVAAALGLEAQGDLPRFLTGEVPIEDALLRPLETLALGLNAARPENAAEILHDRRSSAVLDDMILRTEAETVLLDLPPLLEYDDAAAVLAQVDGVLLISDGTQTTAAQLAACEQILAGQVPLLGVLLNRGRGANGVAAVA